MKILKMLIISLFLFPLTVLASNDGVIVECPNSVKAGEEFICKLYGNSSFLVSAIEYSYELDNSLEFISCEIDSIWEGSCDKNALLLYTDTNKINQFNIGEFKLKSKDNINNPKIETIKLSFGDENFNEVVLEQKNVNNMKSTKEKNTTKKNNFFKYVIIILIVGILIIGVFLYKKIGSDKNEK